MTRLKPTKHKVGKAQSCRVLAASCAHVTLSGPDQTVTGLTADSRQVRPGFIFAALPGSRTSGNLFVQDALKAGATVILHDGTLSLPENVTQLQHDQPRYALALMSAAFHGHPARAMTMIAITGTNGKTSTTAMIEAILSMEQTDSNQKQRVGVIGTTGIRYPNILGTTETIHDSRPLTTPDPVTLHHHLRVMADNRCSVVVMEVSSHALDQQRTAGIPWRVAVFTNLTRDHLDYHGSQQAYFDSKASLFLPNEPNEPNEPQQKIEYPCPQIAVIGTDDPWGKKLAQSCTLNMPVWTFGMDSLEADTHFRASDIVLSWQESRFRLITPEETVDICLPSAGHFNVANALAAAATCWQLGVRGAAIARGLRCFHAVPGRMESIRRGQSFAVVVDYAHTPDALKRLLYNARLLTKQGRIITLFGCGGDRDTGKRAIMGQLAARLGEYSIITDDNPRSEDPAAIRQAILHGCRQESGHAMEIPDRALAIAQALELATPGDAVLIVGKGHETVQITASGTHPFDDAQTAHDHLTRMGF